MKWLSFILLTLSTFTYAGTSGVLLLRGVVPSSTRVVLRPGVGNYVLLSNHHRYSLTTHVSESHSEQGHLIVTIIPQ